MSAPAESDEPQFCCWGCRFACQVTGSEGESAQSRMALTRLGLAIFFTMNVMVLTLALWSKDVYGQASIGEATALYDLLRYASLFLSSMVLALLGLPFAEEAWRRLRVREVSTELLVVLGVSAAYAYSVFAVWTSGKHTYFEVVCMVLVAMTLGRWLQASSRVRTTSVLRQLESLLPTEVRVIGERGECVATDIHTVQVGQSIRIEAGERIPLDGVIRSGRALVDEQVVTGESALVTKEVGEPVVAAALTTDGRLTVEVSATYDSGSLKRIVDAVVAASRTQTPWQQRADRWAARFLPLVAAIAVATLVYHWQTSSLGAGILASLAVLLIACPCALGFATPLAECTAMITAARHGVIVRNGAALERLSQCRTLCIDKTGTLSDGELRVERAVFDPATAPAVAIGVARKLSSASSHRMSQAVYRFAQQAAENATADLPIVFDAGVADISVTNADDAQDSSLGNDSIDPDAIRWDGAEHVPGRGLVVAKGEQAVRLGNMAWMTESRCAIGPRLQQSIDSAVARGESFACLAWGHRVRAHFVCQETLRVNAGSLVRHWQRLGWSVTMVTGDHESRAQAVADELQIDYQAQQRPADKRDTIHQLQQRGNRVVMLGDGANDAPALMQADVGIVMGCGADIARDAADICLRGSDLAQADLAIRIANRTASTIRQNLLWAFGYNSVGVTLAATGHLNPIWAAVAMVGSSLLVIANSVRLLRTPTGSPSTALSDTDQASTWSDPLVFPSQPATVKPANFESTAAKSTTVESNAFRAVDGDLSREDVEHAHVD